MVIFHSYANVYQRVIVVWFPQPTSETGCRPGLLDRDFLSRFAVRQTLETSPRGGHPRLGSRFPGSKSLVYDKMIHWTPLVQKDGLVLKPYLNFLEGLVLSQDTVGLQGLSHLPRASRGKPADQHTHTHTYTYLCICSCNPLDPTFSYSCINFTSAICCTLQNTQALRIHIYIYTYTHTYIYIHIHTHIYICAPATLDSAVHLSQLSSRMLWSGGLRSLAPSAAVCKRHAPSFCLWESAFLHISSPGPLVASTFCPWIPGWQLFQWVLDRDLSGSNSVHSTWVKSIWLVKIRYPQIG